MPGENIFIIVDSCQVEARILAWIAGQEDLTNGFRNKEDIYSTFATRLFGCEVRKPVETDSDSDRRIFTIRRGFGKDAILGCGYGMGTNTFFQRCRENPELRPMFDSGKYDWDFIDKLIKTYRRTYAQIPKFWQAVEKCFKWATRYPNEVIAYTADYETNRGRLQNALLTFWNQDGTVYLQLPSGRTLTYRHCRVINKKIKWQWGTLWGGSITENIIQSIARDLLGYWILELEKANLPVVLHAHDETISLVPKSSAEHDLKRAIATMSMGPEWTAGLPLSAEGELSGVYKK